MYIFGGWSHGEEYQVGPDSESGRTGTLPMLQDFCSSDAYFSSFLSSERHATARVNIVIVVTDAIP